MEEMIKMGKGDSIQYHVDKLGILRIQIDTTKELGPSASGKTTLIASSGGNASINIGRDEEKLVKIGLNLYY
jgi:hypothetical protein